MNNKGFIVSGFVYTILIIFVGLLISVLALLNSRKTILDNLKNKILGDVYTTTTIRETTFNITGEVLEYSAPVSGYYNINLYSPKINNQNGSTVSFDMYLNSGEVLYVLVGSSSYNNGITEVRKAKTSNTFATSSSSFTKNNVNEFINDTVLTNIDIKENNYTDVIGKVIIKFINKSKENEDLNQVRYIKDCVSGNSVDNIATFSEIKAIINGQNKALNKDVTVTVTIDGVEQNLPNLHNIIDNNKDTQITLSDQGEVCAIVDLVIPRNLDSINIYHKQDITFYESKTYVSLDGVKYKLIRNYEKKEDINGLVISSYETKQVSKVGDIYVPVKEFENAIWLRVFHHNNVSGTVLWDSIAQVSIDNGHSSKYKQSILYNLNNYKSNKGFEFLLEFSDRDGYNRWIQTSNPVTSEEEKVTGFEPIKISWAENGWGGLVKSRSGATFIDGTPENSNWHYAIGSIRSWNGGIPANNGTSNKETTDLWVRIDNLK